MTTKKNFVMYYYLFYARSFLNFKINKINFFSSIASDSSCIRISVPLFVFNIV